ncbi:MAG: S8 family serine peptidase, partial [Eubacterium sp.]|nr:S8 family serine peptidase [Eubacterium sp.]
MKKFVSIILAVVMFLSINAEAISVFALDNLSVSSDKLSAEKIEGDTELSDAFFQKAIDLINEYPTKNAYSKIIVDVQKNTIKKDEEEPVSLKEYDIDYSNVEIPVPVLPVVAVLDQMGAKTEMNEETGEVFADFGDCTEHYLFAEDEEFIGDVVDAYIENGMQEIITTEGVAERSVGYMTEEQADDMLNLETEYSNGKFIISNPYQSKRLCVNMREGKMLSDNYSAIKSIYDGTGYYILQFETEEDTRAAYEALSKNRNVSSVTCDKIVTASALPNREGAELIQSDRYKKYLSDNSKNTPITVAVIDTGVDSTHSFLKSRMLKGRNFSYDGNETDTSDIHGHGTHVSGIIVDNTPSNVKILPIKALGNNGSGSSLQIGLAIKYAVNQGADIINMSLGGICHDECEIETAIAEAVKNGVTVCVAAGNEAYYTDDFCPAKVKDCITVAASTNNGNSIAEFSNFGSAVDLTAPGVNILSCRSGGGYVEMDGTSMACPFASASAAMVLTDNPNLKPAEVESKLKSFCTDMLTDGNDIHSGVGLLNFGKLLGDKNLNPGNLMMVHNSYDVDFFSATLPFLCNTYVLSDNVCSDRTFTITNSNPDVAEYDGRLVTPKKSGKTEITVSLANGTSTKLTINLKKTDVWTEYAAKNYAGGNGTEASPYLISNARQLAKFAYDIRTDFYASEKSYKLTNDIDLAGKKWISASYVNPDTLGQIVPSWDNDNFRGVFDGNNHIIKNMDVLDTSIPNIWNNINFINNIWYPDNSGLFDTIEAGTVKNLGLVDAYCPSYGGGILTSSIRQGSRISNCFTTGFSASCGFTGQIVNSDIIIKNCFSSATVLNSGFANLIYSSMEEKNVSIYNCFFSGIVLAADNNSDSSGFSKSIVSNEGYNSTKIYNCFSASNGTIKTDFTHLNEYSTISGCHYYGEKSTILNNGAVKTNVRNQSLEFFKNKSSYTDSSNWDQVSTWDFNNVWAINSNVNNGFPYLKNMSFNYSDPMINTSTWLDSAAKSYAGGNGTANSPYQISNAEQLAKLAYDYRFGGGENVYFRITKNIDLGGKDWYPIGGGDDINSICVGENSIKKKVFLGNIDGNGKTISNMTVSSSGDYMGFISIYAIGTIKNLHFKNAKIEGRENIGVVCGENRVNGKIVSCTAVGNTTGSSYVGSICGQNNSLAHISGCKSSSSKITSADTDWIGGLCAYNSGIIDRSSVINCSISQPFVYEKEEHFVYANDGTIENCYSNALKMPTDTHINN